MDRFDLEQNILNCWNVIDDIKLITENIKDGSSELSKENTIKLLESISSIYNLKFERTFNMFEQLISEGRIK